MALVIEDGSVVASADSYTSLATYQAYVTANLDLNFNGHGHDTTHELNLRRAAQYLTRSVAWNGYTAAQDQALSWPRTHMGYVAGWAVPTGEVPQAIKDAQCELAYLFETESLNPFATIDSSSTSETIKIGPITTAGETLPTGRVRVVAVEGLLRPYLAAGTGQVRLVRG